MTKFKVGDRVTFSGDVVEEVRGSSILNNGYELQPVYRIKFSAGQVIDIQGGELTRSHLPDTTFRDQTINHDEISVDRFASAMKSKLAKKASEGRRGWEDKSVCSNNYLSQLLIEHVHKGDPVDIANIAMMLHQRGERLSVASILSDTTFREQAAIAALQGLLASGFHDCTAEEMAHVVVNYAEALDAERKKRGEVSDD